MQLGAQTYTIREHTQTQADFALSMRKIADIGYTTVQLSAIGSLPVQFLRDTCDEHGLRIVLTHTDPDRMLTDPEGVITDHNTLGCPYIGIGMMPQRYRSPGTVGQFAKDYLPTAQLFRDAGKKLLYHHHALEWERGADGRTMLEVMLADMPNDLLGITLDTYWVQAAGADVCDTISLLAGRIPCVHLKDMAAVGFEQRMAVVGEGNLPFEKILALLQQLDGTEYLLVEQDQTYGEDPFDCLRRSYTYLNQRGYT